MSDNINFKDVSPNSTRMIKPVSETTVEVLKPQVKNISHITGSTVKYVNPIAIRKEYIKVSRMYNQKLNRKLAVRTAKVNGSILKLNNAVASGNVAEVNLQKAVLTKDEKQISAAREQLIRTQNRLNVQKEVLNKSIKHEAGAKKKADASKKALLPSDKIKISVTEKTKEKSMLASKGAETDNSSILGSRQSMSIIGKNNGSVQLKSGMGKGAYGIKKAVSGSTKAVSSSAKAVGKGAKESIKGIAKLKAVTDMVSSGDMSTSMVNMGKSGVRLAADIGARMIQLAVKEAVRMISTFSVFLISNGLLPVLIVVMLVTTSAGSVRSRRTTDDDNTYSITGGDYEYVSYKQTKYEAMFKDENGNTENGWCGVTAYADALASVGCTNESGEKITPYDVRTDEDCGSQYVNVGGWCAKFISSNFPDVNYEYALGYTKDWIDEKLSEGMMVGIYLSSRANWKENYTGKTKVTSSAHWILIVGKISNTEYSCINPADGSGDENYVQEENAEYGSVGTLTIDLSGLTSSSPSASSGDIRICSGDSAGSSDGKPRTSYSPPAFAIGTDATQNVTLESDGSYYVDENGNKYISLGDDWTITAYCGCSLCCGSNADGITASGAKARANHTIAVDTSVIPMGTKVVIDGVVYTAEDTGSAIVGHKIDVYMEHHEEASHYKKTNYTVYKKAEED